MKPRIVHGVAILLFSIVSTPNTHAGLRAPMPAETVTRDSVTRLSADAFHACHVVNDGTVRCWGDNGFGQLGDGTTTNRPTPVPVNGLTAAVAIAAGRVHTCALLGDGTARCWGANGSGQLGDGATTSSLTPVAVSGPHAEGVLSAARLTRGRRLTARRVAPADG